MRCTTHFGAGTYVNMPVASIVGGAAKSCGLSTVTTKSGRPALSERTVAQSDTFNHEAIIRRAWLSPAGQKLGQSSVGLGQAWNHDSRKADVHRASRARRTRRDVRGFVDKAVYADVIRGGRVREAAVRVDGHRAVDRDPRPATLRRDGSPGHSHLPICRGPPLQHRVLYGRVCVRVGLNRRCNAANILTTATFPVLVGRSPFGGVRIGCPKHGSAGEARSLSARYTNSKTVKFAAGTS